MVEGIEEKYVERVKELNNQEMEIYKRRWIILFANSAAAFMATLDGSIVNVALPDMGIKLNVSMARIEWVVTSYLITIVASILIFGRLGDIKGKTKIFRVGVALFTLGSLLCGLTNSLFVLVVARGVQAVGAAAMMANNPGIITQVFPPNERGRALGVLGTIIALGAMAGPPLGGIIVSHLSWQYIFLINIPIGIIVFILTSKVFPKTTKVINEKLDRKGAVLFGIATVSLFGALVEGQTIGYNNGMIIAAFIISFAALVTFIWVETKTEQPLLYLRIFSNNLFSISIACGFISFIAISASNIILPFYFQQTLKISPALTGLFMMVSPIVLSVVAPFSGHISDKIGSEILTLVGLVLTTLGLALIATLDEKSSVMLLLGYIVIMAIGTGMFQSPNNSLVMSAVSKDKLGIAGSVNALIRNLGMVLGTALAMILLYNRMSAKAGHRVTDYIAGRDDIFIYGMQGVYLAAAGLCAVGIFITSLRLYRRKKNRNKVSLLNDRLIIFIYLITAKYLF